MKRSELYLLMVILFFLNIPVVRGQLSAPGAVASEKTQYPVYPETDDIFVFCTSNPEEQNGVLRVSTELEGTKTFLWEKYNSVTHTFEEISSETNSLQESTKSSLESGGYRVTISQNDTTRIYRAWVFNNWLEARPEITGSDCKSFVLTGNYEASEMVYYDLSDQSEISPDRGINFEWKEGTATIAITRNPQIFDPPVSDTEYALRIYDRFSCESNAFVTYEAIITKAAFSASPVTGEAPLTVEFTNQSENGEAGRYEWFFFRDLDEIKKESENTTQPVDSIMLVAYDDNPVYTFENSGTYMVKLVSKHTSESGTCTDTAYLEDYIVADTSFIAVPNVFTPNGDGTNDQFIVKFWSMKNLKIQIYNRWGKRIHFWESNNIRGFGDTYTETVWDGRLGGRYASPGVYYYIVEGRGRDDEIRKAHGFFHLFRGKN